MGIYNLHVGLPGIVPDLLHSVAASGILKEAPHSEVMPRKLWYEQFRGLVNAKKSEALLDLPAWQKVEATLDEFCSGVPIAISQHALLGSPEDCFLKGTVLPNADTRIERVSEIFAANSLTLHLTISNQTDYLHSTMSRLQNKDSLLRPRVIPSWSALIRRMRAAAPERQIIVWDFEQPEKIALTFVLCLLNTSERRTIEKLGKHLATTLQKSKPSPNTPKIDDLAEDLVCRLDVQYELDLADISQIEGVSLILPDAIPDECYL